MVQHVLLLVVAPPLIVLARPWVRLWRCLPLGTRRSLARSLAKGERMAPLRSATRLLGSPLPGFVLFSVVLLAWHLPVLFEATLRSEALHALEHTLFFGTALMFWKQVIPSPPLHARLLASQRVLYAVGAMIVSWILAVVLALAPHPLYAYYAHLARRPGGISAMADQQLAAGIMWVPGSITLVIVIPSTSTIGSRRLRFGRVPPGWRLSIRRVHMSSTAVPLASDFLAGSILTLVIPVTVVIIVTIWYVLLWRRGTGER